MAVLGKFSCWIQVDHNPLPEYRTLSDPEKKRTLCWIPSEVGKAFEVHYGDEVRALTTAAVVKVDGQDCGNKIIFAKESKPRGRNVVVKKGVSVSDSSIRPFVFSQCQYHEDETLSGQSTSVGQIIVDIFEVSVQNRIKERKSTALGVSKIYEGDKQHAVHCTRLGDEVKRAAKKPSRTTRLRTLATFIFMYRPLGILLAMGIAPSPKAIGSDGSSAEDAMDITQQDGEGDDYGSPSRPLDSSLEPRDRLHLEQGADEKQVLVRKFMVSKDLKLKHDAHAKEEGIDAEVLKLEERLLELRAVKMEGVDIKSKERQRGFGMAQSKGGSLRSPIDIPDDMVKVEGAP